MTLAKQIVSGDFPTPTMGQQMAPAEAWYSIPVGKPTTTEMNRAMEALARIQMGELNAAFVNAALAEKAGISGDAGPAFKAIWIALAKAASVSESSSEDSSLGEWQRRGCPV